jgi:hypothetical protein
MNIISAVIAITFIALAVAFDFVVTVTLFAAIVLAGLLIYGWPVLLVIGVYKVFF